MSLTEIEKQILGYMTDKGLLVGATRQEVATDDTFARQTIVQYKLGRTPQLEQIIETSQTELDLLNSYMGE